MRDLEASEPRRQSSVGGCRSLVVAAAPPSGRNGPLYRMVRRAGLAARDFWRARGASVALEGTLAVGAPVITLAVVMQAVNAVYADDSIDRAARAAARAVALTPSAYSSPSALSDVACDAIRQELALEENFDCGGKWTITIDTGLTPQNLLAGASPTERTGEMVRVRIAEYRPPEEPVNMPVQTGPIAGSIDVERIEFFGSSLEHPAGAPAVEEPEQLAEAVARTEPEDAE